MYNLHVVNIENGVYTHVSPSWLNFVKTVQTHYTQAGLPYQLIVEVDAALIEYNAVVGKNNVVIFDTEEDATAFVLKFV